MLTRRLFLAGAVAAPAIVRAESLMKLWVPPERKVVGPFSYAGEDCLISHVKLDSELRREVDKLCGVPQDFYWMGLDLGARDTAVVSLYRGFDRVAVLPAPALRTDDVLTLTVDGSGYASVSVRR